jgi:hypothetical protein
MDRASLRNGIVRTVLEKCRTVALCSTPPHGHKSTLLGQCKCVGVGDSRELVEVGHVSTYDPAHPTTQAPASPFIPHCSPPITLFSDITSKV